MNIRSLFKRLTLFPSLLRTSVESVDDAEARFRPETQAWSIVEILGHMLDEERDDFRPRLRSTLEDPQQPWAAIDPPTAVREHGHQDASKSTLLEAFCKERHASLQWLEENLERTASDWDRTYKHPSLGALRAGDLLLSWVNHDHLHMRQIGLRLYQLSLRDGEPYVCDYAGPP